MAEAATKGMTPEEFFLWQERQGELYELVRGRPVPRAMTGATRRHDMVVVNAIAFFRSALRGTACHASTDDLAVVSSNQNVRRPDLTIDCAKIDPSATRVDAPVLVLEVLSPSTAEIDRLEKLEEYRAIASMEYILIADPGTPHVMVYRRGEDRAWTYLSRIGLESSLELPKLGCTLSLGDLYEDVPPAGARPGS